LIDPFTGEGIGNAMKAGYHAAEHLALSLQNGRRDPQWMRSYDQRVYKDLGGELQIGKTLQQLTNYPRLFDFVVGKAAKNRELRNLISSMFDDISLRSRLRNPLFYLRLLLSRD
jgi:flavin-dependent dehydrogenase